MKAYDSVTLFLVHFRAVSVGESCTRDAAVPDLLKILFPLHILKFHSFFKMSSNPLNIPILEKGSHQIQILFPLLY